jgi:acyl carrier protein
MSALDDLKSCFVETFDLSDTDPATLAYHGIPAWDSVGHMQLIAAIETRFDIMIETQDILDMSDFQQAVAIVRKYGIDV